MCRLDERSHAQFKTKNKIITKYIGTFDANYKKTSVGVIVTVRIQCVSFLKVEVAVIGTVHTHTIES